MRVRPAIPSTAFALAWALGALLPGASAAQDFTGSEQAARSLRALTEDERALRREGCAALSTPGGSFTVAEGLSGPVFQLPAYQVLEIVRLVYSGAETDSFTIAEFQPLPWGGIAGKDICEQVSVDGAATPTEDGDIASRVGLILRDGADVPGDYPNTWVEIEDRGQLAQLRGGAYVALDKASETVRSWYDANGRAWMQANGERATIITRDKVFLPVDATAE